MEWWEALLLGLVQGLTEFLPVSSSGHLELGKVLLNVQAESDITFTVVVHGATVLSTLVVFFREIWKILAGTFKFRWNEETQYVIKIILSMIPVLFVGFFLEDFVESFFSGNVLFVGFMLWITALLLLLSWFFRKSNVDKPVGYGSALLMGIAQAFATLPGISRSGATIATGLLLRNNKGQVAQFSFLMVLIPIIGANVIRLTETAGSATFGMTDFMPLIIGFIAAFLSGWLACSWMVNLVRKGKLIGFAVYCFIIGALAIGSGLFIN
jgi:undecaprenyl-diphosphatase